MISNETLREVILGKSGLNMMTAMGYGGGPSLHGGVGTFLLA